MEEVRPMDRETARRSGAGESGSQLARLGSMFLSPGRTFGEIARRPTIAVVLVATALAGALAATAVSRASDLDAMVQHTWQQQTENMPGSFSRNMSEADRARALDATRTGLRLTRNLAPVIGGLGGALSPVLASAVLLLVFGILGSAGSYRGILSTVAHAWWPAAAASSLLTTVVVWLSHPMAPERAGAPLRVNLAAAFPDPGGVAPALAGRVDLFLAWELVLLGIGLAVTLGISRRRSFAVAVGLWALVSALAAGVALVSGLLNFGFSSGPA